MGCLIFRWAVAAAALALVGCAAVPTPVAGGLAATPTNTVKLKPASTAIQSIEVPPEVSVPSSVPTIDSTQPDAMSVASARELERGGASWYGPGFHGKRTANGERYDMNALTAAHKTLPFGTMVRVKSLVNGREVLVRITDRGPFIRNRVIDLSRAAAVELDMLNLGFKQVVLMVAEREVVGKPAVVVKRLRRR